jgi:hypothetical protein
MLQYMLDLGFMVAMNGSGLCRVDSSRDCFKSRELMSRPPFDYFCIFTTYTMVPQELILSACSTAQASSSSTNKASSSAPAIQLHDLTTSAHVQSFKTSSNTAHSLALTYSHDGVGGTVWAVQEGKAIVGIWAWQKV